MKDHSLLLSIAWAAKRRLRCKMPELTVLSRGRDPYLLSDGNAAGWFAEQVDRFVGPSGVIHLRGLHYRIVVVGDIRKPSGKPYINDEDNWDWLQEVASKNARWLNYIPFERIIDRYNDAPFAFIPEVERTGWSVLGADFPDLSLDAVLPVFEANVAARQPYRIIFIGEKSSLKDILLPIAKRVEGELLLPTGEISDTMLAELAKRCAADGRPAVVLYCSDFDPSGWQMPVSAARKLQALRDLHHPRLQIEVHRVALNLEHAMQFDLPSTPLKETELRKDKWLERWGREQTEIDSLIEFRPDDLQRIAEEAVAPFWDPTLADRAEAARDYAEAEMLRALGYWEEFQELQLECQEAAKVARQAVKKLEVLHGRAVEMFHERASGAGWMPDLQPPQPEIAVGAPPPLFTTNDSFEDATRKLKAYRGYDTDNDS